SGLADAFNVDITNATAIVNLNNVTGSNTVLMRQENGLRQIVDSGGTLTTTVTNSIFSSNQFDGVFTQLRDAGTVANLTMSGTTINANVRDGFSYDVTQGTFTAGVTTSTFDGNLRNGIRSVGAATATTATTACSARAAWISCTVERTSTTWRATTPATRCSVTTARTT
ncbi:MAG: hypothetical protein IH897_07455, partial [Planctomycetes bacterium]|nr:hypothetical protein [Planctomycetota bacterium]